MYCIYSLIISLMFFASSAQAADLKVEFEGDSSIVRPLSEMKFCEKDEDCSRIITFCGGNSTCWNDAIHKSYLDVYNSEKEKTCLKSLPEPVLMTCKFFNRKVVCDDNLCKVETIMKERESK